MIDQIFKRNGLLHANLPEFIPRASQLEMAEAVFGAIQFSGNLVCESGTGTGKTYAYLVPAILSEKRTVISTATRALQEQIYFRDLPNLLRVLDTDINVSMLKGRANYLCRYRLKQAQQQTDMVGIRMRHSLSKINKWANTTLTGDLSEMEDLAENSPVLRVVTSTSENCLGGHCPDFNKCHVNTARKKAAESELVVINHHVYFSDLSLRESGFGGLLPEHDVIIFDEAHSLPDIASNFLGFAFSSTQVSHLIEDIQGAELEENSSVDFRPGFMGLELAVNDLTSLANSSYQGPKIYGEVKNKQWEEVTTKLKLALGNVLQALETAAPAGTGLSRCRDRAVWMSDNLWTWCDDSDQNSARWFTARSKGFNLNSTPLDVGQRLREHMKAAGTSRIFTSATLSVERDFKPFMNKIGLSEQETDTGFWESPYDYAANSRLLIDEGMPEPNDPDFAEAIKQLIIEIGTVSQGRAFCLFTSFAMLNRVHDLVQAEVDWPIYRQGDMSKQILLDNFVENDHSMLFGTSTFWQGVDIKGDALRCVIIDKLPFGYPEDPVMKSRIRYCNEHGENAFMHIQIPEAVVALKQGAGRLIRSEKDRGVLVICDSRILNKPYGKQFLDSLPPMPVVRNVREVKLFFKSIV
ncbi:MAG: ATP-dependent DNA helicase [Gammaproteobacteria bacterium]|nr:ATP-dependent DNA helicase [Gammaproteobacteria bacterium]MCY4226831.1 ATP-dependent DNA helicase [Gammaproteobacteria bacterium]